ncbi:competence protein CoiA [Staphylococcus hominis]
MLVAINRNNETVYAYQAIITEEYRCPYCKEKLLLKKGLKKIPHFAHVYQSKRKCAKNETEKHYYVKFLIAQRLKKHHLNVEIEPYFSKIMQYPDILVNAKVAIEVQFSRISMKEIKTRSRGFKQIGITVIWIIEQLQYNKGYLYLNTFQAYFINPIDRTLYSWDHEEQVIVKYINIQHIGGRKFIAHRQIIQISELLSFNEKENYLYCYKLSNRHIYRYIINCRRKRSVLEPSLSAMYQLQMNDDEVCRDTGYIFPYQIFIENHPVQWQLKLKLLLKYNLPKHYLMSYLKFRQFYLQDINKKEITLKLIDDYIKQVSGRLSVQN